jgi:hypothetical protein
VDVREYARYYTSWKFTGETCDFDPEQVLEKDKCLKRLSDVSKNNAKSRKPKLGEPVVAVSDEIYRYAPEGNRENVNSLVEIIKNSLHEDPSTVTRALNQLERELGLAGISRLITIGTGAEEQKVIFQH